MGGIEVMGGVRNLTIWRMMNDFFLNPILTQFFELNMIIFTGILYSFKW